MKKTLFRITNNLNIGGVQKRLVEVLPELLPYLDIHIIVYKDKGILADELEKQGIRVHFIPSDKTWDIKCFLKIANLLKKYQADIVHTHSYGGCIKGAIAAKLAGVEKVISHIHVPLEMHWYGNWKVKRYKKMIVEKIIHRLFVKKVVFVSKALKKEYLNMGKILKNRNKLEVLYNGYDLSAYPFGKRTGNSEYFKVGSMGRFVSSKNFFLFLQIAFELLKYDKKYLFYLIGDGPLMEDLKSYVYKHKAENNFIFTGMVDDPVDILRELDLYVFCSKNEGLGGALIEPLLLGVPTLAIEDSVNCEVLKKGKGGEILPGDKTSFAQKIRYIKENYSDYLEKLDFTPYRDCFSMEKLISRYKDLYEIK